MTEAAVSFPLLGGVYTFIPGQSQGDFLTLLLVPAVTRLVCSPLSGTGNFSSSRFLVSRVLLSSHSLGNKIKCLDCLARRVKVGFGIFFPISGCPFHYVCMAPVTNANTQKSEEKTLPDLGIY